MGNPRDFHDSLLFTPMTSSPAERWTRRLYLLSPLCAHSLVCVRRIFCVSYSVFLLRQLNPQPYADKLLLNS